MPQHLNKSERGCCLEKNPGTKWNKKNKTKQPAAIWWNKYLSCSSEPRKHTPGWLQILQLSLLSLDPSWNSSVGIFRKASDFCSPKIYQSCPSILSARSSKVLQTALDWRAKEEVPTLHAGSPRRVQKAKQANKKTPNPAKLLDYLSHESSGASLGCTVYFKSNTQIPMSFQKKVLWNLSRLIITRRAEQLSEIFPCKDLQSELNSSCESIPFQFGLPSLNRQRATSATLQNDFNVCNLTKPYLLY